VRVDKASSTALHNKTDNRSSKMKYRLSDLTIDTGRQLVSRATDPIPLPKLSYDLLLVLVQAAPNLVSQDELMRLVWPGIVVSPETVSQRVKLLRDALDDDPRAPRYIAGLRGRGYQLAAAAEEVGEKSIAVLPFTDLSEKKDQEFFADGMAEEIIDFLVKIPRLKVISRTSSFQFKGAKQDLRSIGTQLGVGYLLEGSVRRSDSRLRVTAQLIDCRDGMHLMSQTYERDISDVLKVQDEIAATLVRALQIEVSADAGTAPRPASRSTEAYASYLRGRHAHDRYDQQGFEQAVDFYQRALDLDPSFAAAAAALAVAYSNLGIYGFMPPALAYEQARRAAENAVALNPNLAPAHATLAMIIGMYYWDWPTADREMKRALALAPNHAPNLLLAARQSLAAGRWDDTLKLQNRSLEQDPLNPSSYLVRYYAQVRNGRLAEAEAAIRRTLEISPTFSSAHYYLGIVLLVRYQFEAALAEMLKERDDATRLGGSAMAYFALGRQADSDAALTQMLNSQADHHPFHIALVYAFRGEADEALKWLDRAYVQKDVRLLYIKGEPLLKNLDGNPRYEAFLQKMALPE
jgi:adenylate cyclase